MTDADPDATRELPVPYLVARVRSVLAHDDRVAALDLGVRIVGRDVFLTGSVPTDERAHAAGEIVRELLPDHVVHNQVTAVAVSPPVGSEQIE